MADITRWNGTAGYPILKLNEAATVTASSQSTTAFNIELTGGDYKTVIMMKAGANAANVDFNVGNGIQGAGSKLTVAVGANATKVIVLDSGYFKNVKDDSSAGIVKGSVNVKCSAACDFTVFELPQ